MIGTFLASEVRLLVRLLESRRIDAIPVLRAAGLNPALIEQPRARYPFERVVAAWSRAVDITGDADIGIELARVYRPTDFHGLAVVFLASSDLEKALQRLVRFHAVVNTAVKMKLERRDHRIDLLCTPVHADAAATRVLESARAAILVDICRVAASRDLDPAEVAFTHAKPADTSAYDAFFRSSLVFGAPSWRLSFRTEDAARPFLASNRDLARSNDEVLDQVVQSLKHDDLVSRVKMAMVDELPSGTPSEESIAKAVSMSARSLQRRLAEERTSFTELLASVRRELAERYVRDARMPVTEISYMLGFSDLSSFSRAFKRWTGRSPAASRHRTATA
jgi:AraC-like DNA-binding protein